MIQKISDNLPHKMPADLQKTLASDSTAQEKWQDITPLAKNEWICWIKNAKKQETRSNRIKRTKTELKEGKRRPCCWAGCNHR